MKRIRVPLLALMTIAFVLPPAAGTAEEREAPKALVLPITGAGSNGVKFNGTVAVHRFFQRDGQVFAVSVVSGTLSGPTGPIGTSLLLPVAFPVHVGNGLTARTERGLIHPASLRAPDYGARVMLAQAQLLATFVKEEQAFGLYQQFLKEFPDYPDPLGIYQKMLPLARSLKKASDVEKIQKELERLSPPALPAVGAARVFAPSCLARVTAAVMPRALKEPVGFSPSSLTKRHCKPIDAPRRLAWTKAVIPSPRETGSSLGSTSA